MIPNRFARLLPPLTLCAAAAAQGGPDFLLTYSQPEITLSGSAGTVLRFLHPNEIAHLERSAGPCSSLSAEKWAPRTCFHTMAGDEDGDAQWWEPGLFGSIDALMEGPPLSPVLGGSSARTVFYSPSVAMGTVLSGAPGLRPGDVGRIVRDASLNEGQVEYFMRQEQFNLAMGLPPATPIDVDAIAFAPGLGVYYSLDQDTPIFSACGPAFAQDGAILCIPDWAITYNPNWTVAAVMPNSAVIVYSEAQVDAMVVNAQITDRFGNCITSAIDLESLEIDWNGTMSAFVGCAGIAVQVPDLLFSTETMTGAGLCTTALGGQIYTGSCVPSARSCGFGPTLGAQMGVQPTSSSLGAPSYVNALTITRSVRYSMEPQQHVVNVPAGGLPFGSQMVDISSPFPINFVFWTPATSVAGTATASFTMPLALPLCFPDFYPWPNYHTFAITAGGFASWPMLPIPAGFVGNVLFQSVALTTFNTWELSTPITIEFQ
ncbi:MAG: hypothetical protein KF830_03175 [Planctomycetes bacterium]|nr:hypothetical protein [Planctomycetota bacterium]